MAQNIASSLAVAPAGGEQVLLVGPVAGPDLAYAVIRTEQAVSGGMDIEVYAHPVAPPPPGQFVGTYYPNATQVALATAMIGAGEDGVVLRGNPDNVLRHFGLTVRNNDTITHELHIDIFSEADGAEG